MRPLQFIIYRAFSLKKVTLNENALKYSCGARTGIGTVNYEYSTKYEYSMGKRGPGGGGGHRAPRVAIFYNGFSVTLSFLHNIMQYIKNCGALI